MAHKCSLLRVAVAVAATLASAAAAKDVGGSLGTLEFADLEPTFGDRATQGTYHSKSVTKNNVTMPLEMFDIGKIGDELNGVVFGALVDSNGNILRRHTDNSIRFSDSPDFTSILTFQDSGKLFSLVHFERPAPALAYLVELEQDVQNCTMKPLRYEAVYFPEAGGIMTPCSGSVTPWGTHLGSEEDDPDAYDFEQTLLRNESVFLSQAPLFYQQMYFWGFNSGPGTEATAEDYRANFFPYLYGHQWEFALTSAKGDYKIEKLFALGRYASELCLVAPDGKTVYCSDDKKNVPFFKFKADSYGDLNAGTLSCAVAKQTSDLEGGSFDLTWLDLGYTADARSELEPLARELVFSDMFEAAPFDKDLRTCPDGFTAVSAKLDKGLDFRRLPTWSPECLRLANDDAATRKLAAFFETRRYCGFLGGTTEFTRWEGITFDKDSGRFFVALTSVSDGMLDNEEFYDMATRNEIRVAENSCGCVYALDVEPGTYDIVNMTSFRCGRENVDLSSGRGRCRVDDIASPDNIVSIQGYGELLVAEDTSGHEFNYLWSMNTHTKELTRIASVPYKAEVSGPIGYHFADVNTCDYFLFVNQHPEAGVSTVYMLASNSLVTIGGGGNGDGDGGGDGDGDGDGKGQQEPSADKPSEGLSDTAKAGISVASFLVGCLVLFTVARRFSAAKKEEPAELL